MKDYKKEDIEKILTYMEGKESVGVEDILEHSGAERLRTYAILFELEQMGAIQVMQRDIFGSPESVAKN